MNKKKSRAKCRHWKEYKAFRAPTCGCDYCNAKWKAYQQAWKEIAMTDPYET